MNQDYVQKEELLSLLTGIYDQLEALDKVLEKNLLQYRQDLIHDHSTSMLNCENRMNKLQDAFDLSRNELDRTHKEVMQPKPSMKLELGF